MLDANKLLNQMLGSGRPASGATGGSPIDQIGGLLGGIMSDSVSGMKQGAAAFDRTTGLSAAVDSGVKGATGKSAGDLLEQAKEFLGKNKIATGAALGGLGALLLGSKGGRSVLGGGAALGGLAMIGGLAWNALQSLRGRKPAEGARGLLEPAPAESAFGETGDFRRDDASARLILRAMIAAAACDGGIDNEERSRIVGGLEKAGLESEAAQFLDAELARPASIADLAIAAKTPEMAAQVYTAARMAIDPDTPHEREFLAGLAVALGLEEGLAAHIDAGASAVKH
jgi:uncharacterized membrane protein YebE (DUF533 family)